MGSDRVCLSTADLDFESPKRSLERDGVTRFLSAIVSYRDAMSSRVVYQAFGQLRIHLGVSLKVSDLFLEGVLPDCLRQFGNVG